MILEIAAQVNRANHTELITSEIDEVSGGAVLAIPLSDRIAIAV